MKKISCILLVMLALVSCKNDAKQNTETPVSTETETGKTAKQNDGLTLVVGEFVYYENAAVLQTRTDIYGVIVNEKMQELNAMAKPYKKDDTDYVTVQVRGQLVPKPETEEGWDYRVDIKEIIKVSPVAAEEKNVIKLGSK